MAAGLGAWPVIIAAIFCCAAWRNSKNAAWVLVCWLNKSVPFVLGAVYTFLGLVIVWPAVVIVGLIIVGVTAAWAIG